MQAKDAVEVRRATAAAEAAAAAASKAATKAAVAARRPDVGTAGKLQRQKDDRHNLSQVDNNGGGGIPRAQGAFERGAARSRGVVGSKHATRPYNRESRRIWRRDTPSGMVPALDGDVTLSRSATVEASPLRRGLEGRMICPHCCSSGGPGLARGVPGAGRYLIAGVREELAGEAWRSDVRSPEVGWWTFMVCAFCGTHLQRSLERPCLGNDRCAMVAVLAANGVPLPARS